MLTELSDDQLRLMGERLVQSYSDCQQALSDMVTEQTELQSEKNRLNETISLLHCELQKLDIRAENINEPQPALEGPLEFVGRMWEMVKPRDTAQQVSDHIGEVRKPAIGGGDDFLVQDVADRLVGQVQRGLTDAFESSPSPAEIQRQMQEAGEEMRRVADRVSSAVVEVVPDEFKGKSLSKKSRRLKKQMRRQFPQSWSLLTYAGETLEAARSGMADLVTGGDTQPSSFDLASRQSAGIVSEQPPSVGSFFSYLRSPDQLLQELGTDASGPDDEEADKEQRQQSMDTGSHHTPPADLGRVDSTVLVELRLTLGDGSVQTLEVRAADRAKEVAANFIAEHSLKAWFELPLKNFLMDVEAKAEKFPVRLEADLLEIRRQFSAATC